MHTYRCTIARTPREIGEAQRLRWRVYGEEERLLPTSVCVEGREIDARDRHDGTVHFVVRAGAEMVGTVRLLRADAREAVRSEGRVGLDLESKFDLSSLRRHDIVPAEITRYCVLRAYRCTGVTPALFSTLRTESLRLGITHWVAGANMETDVAEDAAIVHRVADQKSLISRRFLAETRTRMPLHTPRSRPFYTVEQRRRARAGDLRELDLPRTLSVFARRMGARFIGAPAYDAYFNVFALPLVATLADLAVPHQAVRVSGRSTSSPPSSSSPGPSSPSM